MNWELFLSFLLPGRNYIKLVLFLFFKGLVEFIVNRPGYFFFKSFLTMNSIPLIIIGLLRLSALAGVTSDSLLFKMN